MRSKLEVFFLEVEDAILSDTQSEQAPRWAEGRKEVIEVAIREEGSANSVVID